MSKKHAKALSPNVPRQSSGVGVADYILQAQKRRSISGMNFFSIRMRTTRQHYAIYPAKPVVTQDHSLAKPSQRMGEAEYVNSVLEGKFNRTCGLRKERKPRTQTLRGVNEQSSA